MDTRADTATPSGPVRTPVRYLTGTPAALPLWIRFALTLALLCGKFGPATAQTDVERRAAAFITAGEELFGAGDHAGALASFQQAAQLGDAIRDKAGLRWNIARCLQMLGRHLDAVLAFEEYLTVPDTPEQHAAAREHIVNIERDHLARVDVRCNDEDALVQLSAAEGDGWRALADERPCPATFGRLDGGDYRAEGITPAGITRNVMVSARPGEPATVELRFSDGVVAPLEQGSAHLNANVESRQDESGDPWPWVTGTIAAGGIIGGTVLLVMANKNYANAEDRHGDYRNATGPFAASEARRKSTDFVDTGQTQERVAFGLIGLGAGAAALTLWMLTGDDAPPEGGLSIDTTNGYSVGWTGTW